MNVDELTGRWDYSTLPANVSIGRGCFIERKQTLERFRSTLEPGLVIGDGARNRGLERRPDSYYFMEAKWAFVRRIFWGYNKWLLR